MSLGLQEIINVMGMFKALMQTISGEQKRTWVYIVDIVKPDPLLGEDDTEDLGKIRFQIKRKVEAAVCRVTRSMPSKLRQAETNIQTKKTKPVTIGQI